MLFTHFSEINSPTIGSPTEMPAGLSVNLSETIAHDDFPDEASNSGKL